MSAASREAPVRAVVLRSAGTNCDGETVAALGLAGAEVDLLHLNRVSADPARLFDYGILVIAGGFSYGDYVAAGRVFAYELRHRLAGPLRDFVARGGYVLGVCNGFQILVDTGLLEGPDAAPEGELPPIAEREFALTGNESGRFECRWSVLRTEPSACAWLEPGELLPCPSAHAEGRFVVRDDAVLRRLAERGQIALRYVTADGGEAGYPDCPNGSVDRIAGICDPTGRVLGLMPHPERNITPWQHPRWTRLGPRAEGEGLRFYRRLVSAAAGRPLEGVAAPAP